MGCHPETERACLWKFCCCSLPRAGWVLCVWCAQVYYILQYVVYIVIQVCAAAGIFLGCKEAVLCAGSLNTRVYKSLVGLCNSAVWCICRVTGRSVPMLCFRGMLCFQNSGLLSCLEMASLYHTLDSCGVVQKVMIPGLD